MLQGGLFIFSLCIAQKQPSHTAIICAKGLPEYQGLLAFNSAFSSHAAVVDRGANSHAAAGIFSVNQTCEGHFTSSVQSRDGLIVGVQHAGVDVDLQTAEGHGGVRHHVESVVLIALHGDHVLSRLAEVLVHALQTQLVVAGDGRLKRSLVHTVLLGQRA